MIATRPQRAIRLKTTRRNDQRRRVVQGREIEFVDHLLFDADSAETAIENRRPASAANSTIAPRLYNTDTQSVLGALFDHEPLSREEERYLFLRMNYCRFRAARLMRIDTRRTSRQAGLLLEEATDIRNRIAVANQRLVVSIARGFANAITPLDELTAAAQLPLLRAVELFDVSRGYCFSTYATHTIRNHCRRVLSRKSRQDLRVSIGLPDNLEPSAIREPIDEVESTEQSLVDRFFAELVDREKIIIAARFGLEQFERPHTFREIGKLLGLSKERARVLAARAIEKLQELACRQNLRWLEM